MTDLLSTIPLDVVSGIIGAIAGLVVAFLLACAVVLLVSIRRRLRTYTPDLSKRRPEQTIARRMKDTQPMARAVE